MVSSLMTMLALLVVMVASAIHHHIDDEDYSEDLDATYEIVKDYLVADHVTVAVHADDFWLPHLSTFLSLRLQRDLASPVTVVALANSTQEEEELLEVSRSTVIFLSHAGQLGRRRLYPVTSQRLHVLVVTRSCDGSEGPVVLVATVLLLCGGVLHSWFGATPTVLTKQQPLFGEVRDLEGREVVAGVYPWPMRVMLVPASSLAATSRSRDAAAPVNAGLEVQLLELLVARSNASLRYVTHRPEEWAAISDGVRGGVYDVGAATFILEGTMVVGVNASATYDTAHFQWFVPAGDQLPPAESLVRIFSADTWAALLSGYVVYSLCYWMVARRRVDVVISFLTTERALLGSSVAPLPSAPVPRLVLFLWLIFGVVLSSVGQSALFGALVHPGRQRPLRSVEEILATGLPVRSTLSSIMYLTGLGSDKYDEVARLASPCRLEDCVRLLLTERRSAFCDSDAVMDLLVPKELTSSAKAVVSRLETDSSDLMHTMVMRRGFVLARRLDEIIRMANEHGLLVKWREDLLLSQSLLKGDGRLVLEDALRGPLTLEQTQGGFMVLAFGLLVATPVFLLEIFLGYRKTKTKRAVRRRRRGFRSKFKPS